MKIEHSLALPFFGLCRHPSLCAGNPVPLAIRVPELDLPGPPHSRHPAAPQPMLGLWAMGCLGGQLAGAGARRDSEFKLQ